MENLYDNDRELWFDIQLEKWYKEHDLKNPLGVMNND